TVPDPQAPMVGQAKDVAGHRFLGQFALAREKEHRGVNGEIAPGAHLAQLHATAESTRAQAHEGDAVAMVGVHVRLHLEHEARDLWLGWSNRARCRTLWLGVRREPGEAVDQLAHAKIFQSATEEDWRQMTFAIGGKVERRTGAAHQLDLTL